jgi:sugar lactone lactonase YvrE
VLARLWLTAAAIVLLVCAPAALADTTPEYFNVPAGFDSGAGIAASRGTVWFVANNHDSSRPPALGRLIAAQASPGTENGMATFPTTLPGGTGCCVHLMRSLALDAVRNRVWFVQSDGVVGWADPSAVVPGTSAGIVNRLLPNVGNLQDVVPDPRNDIAWFTEHDSGNVPPYYGNRIASVDPSLAVNELPNIAQGVAFDRNRLYVYPAGIALDADGRPWFAESGVTFNAWRIATASNGAYQEYEVKPCSLGSPCSGSNTGTGITDVAVAQDGSIWFTNELRNEVGRFDSRTQLFTSYSLPAIDPGLASGDPRQIAVAPDGSLWVVEWGFFSNPRANALVKIVPTQPTPSATVFHLDAKYPYAVAPDDQGNVWFTAGDNSPTTLIGRLTGVTTPVNGGGTGGGTGDGRSSGGGRPITAVSVARAGPPAIHGTSISVDQMCVGPPADPCSLVFIISAHEYVTGFPGSRPGRASAAAARARRGRRRSRRPAVLILGRKSVTLQGGERRRVTISLNATGRRLLRRAGRLTVYFTVTQKGEDGKPPRRIKAAKLTFKAPRARARRRH